MTRAVATAIVVAMFLPAAIAPAATPAGSSALERQRLQLDIDRLERESGRSAQLQRWLPAGSALAALLVAGYGFWRYFDERKRDADKRTSEGVAHNLERLIDVPSDAGSHSARAVVALGNLNDLAPAESTEATSAQHRARVTNAVWTMIVSDLTDVRTPGDARLPVICLSWTDFESELRATPDRVGEILDRYLATLGAIKSRSPQFLTKAERDGCRFVSSEGSLSEADARLLPEVVVGVERFFDLLPAGDARSPWVDAFSATAPALGSQIFPPPG